MRAMLGTICLLVKDKKSPPQFNGGSLSLSMMFFEALTWGRSVPYLSSTMMMNLDKWRIVESLANQAGVRMETRRKWRIRGVPPSWQIKFVAAAPGLLSFTDFSRERKSEKAA